MPRAPSGKVIFATFDAGFPDAAESTATPEDRVTSSTPPSSPAHLVAGVGSPGGERSGSGPLPSMLPTLPADLGDPAHTAGISAAHLAGDCQQRSPRICNGRMPDDEANRPVPPLHKPSSPLHGELPLASPALSAEMSAGVRLPVRLPTCATATTVGCREAHAAQQPDKPTPQAASARVRLGLCSAQRDDGQDVDNEDNAPAIVKQLKALKYYPPPDDEDANTVKVDVIDRDSEMLIIRREPSPPVATASLRAMASVVSSKFLR